ncbi:MAG: hypothetical protein KatS3mg121_1030 [Gammaproteobacteria bacterium]|nr:MAG: hypothetical protein KatS3mg121_1030 [Gammaproteobacteria bacterium]
MQKALLILGLLCLLLAALWPWLGKLPLGRLPGDIVIDRPGLKIYIPVTSMALVSLLLSLLFSLWRR